MAYSIQAEISGRPYIVEFAHCKFIPFLTPQPEERDVFSIKSIVDVASPVNRDFLLSDLALTMAFTQLIVEQDENLPNQDLFAPSSELIFKVIVQGNNIENYTLAYKLWKSLKVGTSYAAELVAWSCSAGKSEEFAPADKVKLRGNMAVKGLLESHCGIKVNGALEIGPA